MASGSISGVPTAVASICSTSCKTPVEEKDLSKVEAHADKLLEWRQQLIKRLENRPEGFVQNGKLIAGRLYGPLNAGTLSK